MVLRKQSRRRRHSQPPLCNLLSVLAEPFFRHTQIVNKHASAVEAGSALVLTVAGLRLSYRQHSCGGSMPASMMTEIACLCIRRMHPFCNVYADARKARIFGEGVVAATPARAYLEVYLAPPHRTILPDENGLVTPFRSIAHQGTPRRTRPDSLLSLAASAFQPPSARTTTVDTHHCSEGQATDAVRHSRPARPAYPPTALAAARR